MDYKKSRIKQWPVKSNRASNLGHECIRYLVFERTRWEEKKLHGVELQTIFDEGHLHEEAVLTLLRQAGFFIIEQQRAFEWRKYNITGHIDAKVVGDGFATPIEIKSSSPFTWQSFNSLSDLVNHKYHYVRMYLAQMTLYLLMDNKEDGLFLFKNKQTGMIKEIPMKLDYDLGEKLLQKAEVINKHVEENTVPDCISYDENICGDCGYIHICLPNIKRNALEIKDDREIENKLNRWNELKTAKAEYEKLDKDIKKTFSEREKVVVGNYLVTGKWQERKGFFVEPSQFWKTKIQTIEKEVSNDE